MPAHQHLQPLKGMLDLHPSAFQADKAIKEVIDTVARQFSYLEYTTPLLESIELYEHQADSELITEQAYTFVDKKQRKILLRPEITPSLARMVAKEHGQYSLPLRWYTVGNCYRYERPQKGRLREFAQLNFDIIGKTTVLYDLEILKLVETLMRGLAIPAESYDIRYNHRGWVDALLQVHDVKAEKRKQFYDLVDRQAKLEKTEFEAAAAALFPTQTGRDFFEQYLSARDPAAFKFSAAQENKLDDQARQALKAMTEFTALLKQTPFDVRPRFSPTTVRGLDYYTGMVFEVFARNDIDMAAADPPLDKAKGITRSLFGGGRYDNLMAKYGKKPLGAVGFGMGMHIMKLFLAELKLPLKTKLKPKNVYLAPLETTFIPLALHVATNLQTQKYTVHLGINSKNRDTHFSKATKANCTYITFLGEAERQATELTLQSLDRALPATAVSLVPPFHKL